MISYILIGLISIVLSIIVIYSEVIKTRNGTLKWQSISQILNIVCNMLTDSVYLMVNATISAFISLLSNFIALNIVGFVTNFLFLIATSFAITKLKMENDVSQHNSI